MMSFLGATIVGSAISNLVANSHINVQSAWVTTHSNTCIAKGNEQLMENHNSD